VQWIVAFKECLSRIEQHMIIQKAGLETSRQKPRNCQFSAARPTIDMDNKAHYPPLTAPAVSPATICRCAKTVSSSTGKVTISAAAASGPQLNWSNEIML